MYSCSKNEYKDEREFLNLDDKLDRIIDKYDGIDFIKAEDIGWISIDVEQDYDIDIEDYVCEFCIYFLLEKRLMNFSCLVYN